MDDNREAHRKRLRCFGKARQNGGSFHTFRVEEITELFPTKHLKNIYLLNITLYPDLTEKQANEDENITSFEGSVFLACFLDQILKRLLDPAFV